MPLEIESSFFLRNDLMENKEDQKMPTKLEMIRRLKKLGAKRKGKYLFRVAIFYHPHDKKREGSNYIRVRDEGFRSTMTFKKFDRKSGFEDEYEVTIDSYEMGIKILEHLGCVPKYHYEKMREIWDVRGGYEVVFDTQPGLPDIVEVEAPTKKALYDFGKKMKVDLKNTNRMGGKKFYERYYGIQIRDDVNVLFSNMRAFFMRKVKKNKVKLDKLLKRQMKEYQSLVRHQK